jgi:glycine/D-amino acid oxidase-like deaminating enzyme/nitrite reductase/ring-hydroxylating ferredoxin subunit
MSLPGQQGSAWIATTPAIRRYPALDRDVEADVCIVGAGIAGLTAALRLKHAGRTVTVLESRRIGHQVTGRSNAKATSQHGLIYDDIGKRLGEAAARLYAEANQAAIDHIAGWVRDLGIDCGFERRAAYVFTNDDARIPELEREAETARRLGLPSSFVHEVPLPYPAAAAVRFGDQAQINPFAYLDALAAAVEGGGCTVFEDTRVLAVEDGEPAVVTTGTGRVRAKDVVVATNLPIVPDGDFHKKTGPRSHAVVAATIPEADAPDGMFLCLDAPTHSVRTSPLGDGRRLLVVVGESYAPGEVSDVAGMVAALADFVAERFPTAGPVQWHWVNMDYDSVDRIPFIGPATRRTRHLHVATGFGSWGITNGTVAGLLLADLVAGRDTPWLTVFDSRREPGKAPNEGHPPMRSDGEEVARKPPPGGASSLGRGEAAVFETEGDPVAVFRDEGDRLHSVSAVCTHLGCTLAWNDAERSWECPCHGSVFSPDGEVLKGPAVRDLSRREPPGA